ncbi:hypothetical protein OEZ85_004517 [Tetradesmus obliquus]|uniref:START domain-containing protein n=1 Tax=Tetradesmus obliquus TaxID=3088 RepID=A0ABY8UKY7_TETOB|nr:hypothetical protein OEZ85_004517 [Tetradesmus obliquus]
MTEARKLRKHVVWQQHTSSCPCICGRSSSSSSSTSSTSSSSTSSTSSGSSRWLDELHCSVQQTDPGWTFSALQLQSMVTPSDASRWAALRRALEGQAAGY